MKPAQSGSTPQTPRCLALKPHGGSDLFLIRAPSASGLKSPLSYGFAGLNIGGAEGGFSQ